MHYSKCRPQKQVHSMMSAIRALTALVIFGVAARATAQGAPPAPAMGGGMDMPHPFFTHEGLPEGVGSYSLRVLALSTRIDGQTRGDFAFHLEMGLTKFIGLHIRNDGFLNSSKTEAMFQFAAITNDAGTIGFAPIIEFLFPTHSGASGITTETGFTTKYSAAHFAFNQVIHYNPREESADGSAALVFGISDKIFPVVELLGEGGRNVPTVVNVLAGLKVRLKPWITLGFAFELPVTRAKDFTSQALLGPEFVWGKER
jgi:hypothetical protein